MRQELIQQTQDMAAIATAALDSILSLRARLFAEIDNAQDDPLQADRLSDLEKQLSDLDMAIGQVRIYLLGFHRTLATAQAIAQGNIEVSQRITECEKSILVELPVTKRR